LLIKDKKKIKIISLLYSQIILARIENAVLILIAISVTGREKMQQTRMGFERWPPEYPDRCSTNSTELNLATENEHG
jgi:hypothetical protein